MSKYRAVDSKGIQEWSGLTGEKIFEMRMEYKKFFGAEYVSLGGARGLVEGGRMCWALGWGRLEGFRERSGSSESGRRLVNDRLLKHRIIPPFSVAPGSSLIVIEGIFRLNCFDSHVEQMDLGNLARLF